VYSCRKAFEGAGSMRECTTDEVEQHGDESAKEGESGRPAVSTRP